MRTLHALSAERDSTVAADLDPRTRAILERMARVGYVLDQHRIAVARHSQHLAELRAELELIEGGG